MFHSLQSLKKNIFESCSAPTSRLFDSAARLKCYSYPLWNKYLSSTPASAPAASPMTVEITVQNAWYQACYLNGLTNLVEVTINEFRSRVSQKAMMMLLKNPPKMPGMKCRLKMPAVSSTPRLLSFGTATLKQNTDRKLPNRPTSREAAGLKRQSQAAPPIMPPAKELFTKSTMLTRFSKSSENATAPTTELLSERIVFIIAIALRLSGTTPALKDGQKIQRKMEPTSPRQSESLSLRLLGWLQPTGRYRKHMTSPKAPPKICRRRLPPESVQCSSLMQMVSFRLQAHTSSTVKIRASIRPSFPQTPPRAMRMAPAQKQARQVWVYQFCRKKEENPKKTLLQKESQRVQQSSETGVRTMQNPTPVRLLNLAQAQIEASPRNIMRPMS